MGLGPFFCEEPYFYGSKLTRGLWTQPTKSSIFTLLVIQFLLIWVHIHYLTDKLFSSIVMIPRVEPCQTALAKLHCKKRWEVDSTSESHIRQLEVFMTPLLWRISNTGKLSYIIFQTQVRILAGSLTFQKSFQLDWDICGGLGLLTVDVVWSCCKRE